MTKWIDQTTWRFLLVGCINTLFGTSIMFLAYNVLAIDCFQLLFWQYPQLLSQ